MQSPTQSTEPKPPSSQPAPAIQQANQGSGFESQFALLPMTVVLGSTGKRSCTCLFQFWWRSLAPWCTPVPALGMSVSSSGRKQECIWLAQRCHLLWGASLRSPELSLGQPGLWSLGAWPVSSELLLFIQKDSGERQIRSKPALVG